MDFDPRDYDSRDEDRAPTRDRGGRGGSDRDDERDDEWSRPAASSRDRDDEARDGPGDSRESPSAERSRDARDDAGWPERERDERTRNTDPREAFTRHLNLPRGLERQLVRDRDREYTLRGSESRTLATVGAFRVVSSRDLPDHNGRPTDPRSGDLRHLREQGLVETIRVPGYREQAVTLTKEGRSLLESHRDRDQGDRQTFYNGVKRERELEHDVQVYRAYERHAERLEARGARIERVVIDYELKREYQKWLHERDRDRDDYDGHPDRTADEIREWALEHDLRYFDEEVRVHDVVQIAGMMGGTKAPCTGTPRWSPHTYSRGQLVRPRTLAGGHGRHRSGLQFCATTRARQGSASPLPSEVCRALDPPSAVATSLALTGATPGRVARVRGAFRHQATAGVRRKDMLNGRAADPADSDVHCCQVAPARLRRGWFRPLPARCS